MGHACVRQPRCACRPNRMPLPPRMGPPHMHVPPRWHGCVPALCTRPLVHGGGYGACMCTSLVYKTTSLCPAMPRCPSHSHVARPSLIPPCPTLQASVALIPSPHAGQCGLSSTQRAPPAISHICILLLGVPRSPGVRMVLVAGAGTHMYINIWFSWPRDPLALAIPQTLALAQALAPLTGASLPPSTTR